MHGVRKVYCKIAFYEPRVQIETKCKTRRGKKPIRVKRTFDRYYGLKRM